MKCPLCGEENTEIEWPLEIDGEIVGGGCQECWEKQCAELWWEKIKDQT